jgi:lactoylglutathione lyase
VQVQLGGVALNVADLDRSVAFYRDAFGLRELHRIPLPTMTEVIVGPAPGEDGTTVMLVQHADRPGPPSPSDVVEKLYFLTSDAQALFDRALAAGATSETPPRRATAMPLTVAFVRDPDGYKLELVETATAD